jgi:pathogenesis-related protein 1
MKNKIYIALVTALLLVGCSASDVEDFIKDKIIEDNGLVNDTGNITPGEENNISVSAEIQDALDAHNRERSAVGVNSNLVWDETIAKDAQSYADELAISGVWGHDPKNASGYTNGSYGENLYTSTEKVTLAFATDEWADEEQYYTYGEIGDASTCVAGEMCGHYTQIIWKNTSRVGCAMSKYKTGQYKNWYLIVCKYQTPGNYVGQTPY